MTECRKRLGTNFRINMGARVYYFHIKICVNSYSLIDHVNVPWAVSAGKHDDGTTATLNSTRHKISAKLFGFAIKFVNKILAIFSSRFQYKSTCVTVSTYKESHAEKKPLPEKQELNVTKLNVVKHKSLDKYRCGEIFFSYRRSVDNYRFIDHVNVL